MEKLRKKYESLSKALTTLSSAIEFLNVVESHCSSPDATLCPDDSNTLLSCSNTYLAARDSMIQRFEYCSDMLWKYLKEYLLKVHKVAPEYQSPKYIIQTSAKVGIISEEESRVSLDMVDSRNMTSHIYREEIAQTIAHSIPQYYQLMASIVGRIKPKP